jgi:hypothetical protein
MIKSAKNLQKGDRFESSDGRGIETVTFNRPGPKGSRAIRTNRCDHNWPNAKKVEVIV